MTANDSSQYELALHAEGGDVWAQYRLGVQFLLGSGMEQDIEAACRWLMAAAAGHHRDAQALVERLAPFCRGATDAGNDAKTPSVSSSWLAALTHRTRVVFDSCEEASKHAMYVFRRCLTGKIMRACGETGAAARRAT